MKQKKHKITSLILLLTLLSLSTTAVFLIGKAEFTLIDICADINGKEMNEVVSILEKNSDDLFYDKSKINLKGAYDFYFFGKKKKLTSTECRIYVDKNMRVSKAIPQIRKATL